MRLYAAFIELHQALPRRYEAYETFERFLSGESDEAFEELGGVPVSPKLSEEYFRALRRTSKDEDMQVFAVSQDRKNASEGPDALQRSRLCVAATLPQTHKVVSICPGNAMHLLKCKTDTIFR